MLRASEGMELMLAPPSMSQKLTEVRGPEEIREQELKSAIVAARA